MSGPVGPGNRPTCVRAHVRAHMSDRSCGTRTRAGMRRRQPGAYGRSPRRTQLASPYLHRRAAPTRSVRTLPPTHMCARTHTHSHTHMTHTGVYGGPLPAPARDLRRPGGAGGVPLRALGASAPALACANFGALFSRARPRRHRRMWVIFCNDIWPRDTRACYRQASASYVFH